VEFINWTEAKAFVARLNDLEKGLNEYRLPSEAEWEYACRAGSTAAFSSGEDEARLGDAAWFDANAGGSPHPVGKKRANAWGLYDMHGNVWEWCEDTWHGTYQGAPTDGSPWSTGGEAAKRVIRGGSWAFGASEARSGARMPYLAESRVGDSLGLRIVVVPKGEPGK
jgi:formylglycine-generating enzyme required for sulfatase activity